MQQRFVLPEKCRSIESVAYVNVKPQYQQEVAEGQIVLTGIYLIQVELRLGEKEEARTEDGILIEEVDLEGDVAYFEYGLPLSRMLAGERPVIDYQLEKIEGVILPGGVLEIRAQENIARKPEVAEVAQQQEKVTEFVQLEQPVLKAVAQEPVAQLQPEENVELVAQKSGATGIVEWLSLSNHYKTEKVQLNPILKQRVANRTEDKE